MKLLRECGILLGICFLGEMFHNILNLAIPGNVLGMIILFICLYTKVIKLEMICNISNFLLDHLAFFFIPAGVGLISYFDLLKQQLVEILLISLITTIIIMATTGTTVQFIKRRLDK